jgi:hypothetical protein
VISQYRKRAAAVTFLVLLGLAVTTAVGPGTHWQSTAPSSTPDQIIADLLKSNANVRGAFTCGSLRAHAADDQSRLLDLVKLGKTALPAVRDSLASIEAQGSRSRFAVLTIQLSYAYAKMAGQAAYPVLLSLGEKGPRQSIQNGLDDAIALALGLTSYVHVSRLQGQIICQSPSPRYALDAAVIAWEQSDQKSIEALLGQDSRAALTRLLKNRSWAQVRASLSPAEIPEHAAVGYKLVVPGRWSEPEVTLDDTRQVLGEEGAQLPKQPMVEVNFVDRAGKACGNETIRFMLQTGGAGGPRYVIDDPKLETILHLVSDCASTHR